MRIIHVLGNDDLTGSQFLYDGVKDSCVYMTAAGGMKINQGNLEAFKHKIDFGQYNERIVFNMKTIATLIKALK